MPSAAASSAALRAQILDKLKQLEKLDEKLEKLERLDEKLDHLEQAPDQTKSRSKSKSKSSTSSSAASTKSDDLSAKLGSLKLASAEPPPKQLKSDLVQMAVKAGIIAQSSAVRITKDELRSALVSHFATSRAVNMDTMRSHLEKAGVAVDRGLKKADLAAKLVEHGIVPV